MPKLSDTMTEGTLVTWKKKKGDKCCQQGPLDWRGSQESTENGYEAERGKEKTRGNGKARAGESKRARSRAAAAREREKGRA